MKINENLLVYITIEDYSSKHKWTISSNIGEEGYYIPGLENKEIDFYADNDEWIIEKLYKNLKILLNYKKDNQILSHEVHDAINFELEELRGIKRTDYKIIVSLIEQAIELNFFKEYYDKSK